jgi:hypothetical protein
MLLPALLPIWISDENNLLNNLEQMLYLDDSLWPLPFDFGMDAMMRVGYGKIKLLKER